MFTQAIETLRKGNKAQVRPRGHSMTGRINNGQLVTLRPCKPDEVKVDQVVLVKVNGFVFLHIVKKEKGDQVLIGNNRGGLNGWTPKSNVYGIVERVEA